MTFFRWKQRHSRDSSLQGVKLGYCKAGGTVVKMMLMLGPSFPAISGSEIMGFDTEWLCSGVVYSGVHV